LRYVGQLSRGPISALDISDTTKVIVVYIPQLTTPDPRSIPCDQCDWFTVYGSGISCCPVQARIFLRVIQSHSVPESRPVL